MKRRTRRTLFWFAVVLFGAASYVAILYAQGYKYDWARNSFVLTGVVSVTLNTDAKLFVDDILADSTSFLSHRVSQDKLLPGTHTIRLVRDGWSAWRKSIEIKEGTVVDFPMALLLPTDEESQPGLKAEIAQTLENSVQLESSQEVGLGDFVLRGQQLWLMNTASGSLLAEHVLGFATAPDQSRVVWQTNNEIWVTWLRNTDYQPYHAEGNKQLITRFSIPIARAAWFRDNDHVAVDLGSGAYRIVETDTRGGINIIKI